MTASRLGEALDGLSSRAAHSAVARGRIASRALNEALLRRLSARPGERDALLAEPVFEATPAWKTAEHTFGGLSGNLLHPDLVSALDSAERERMPRSRHPYVHQLEAWQAARNGFSCLVSSGTGSGKTECFMVPMLDGLLRDSAKGKLVGVRAIVVYPLNALIESQRERLAAWTEALKDRIGFALYNGMTPEAPRHEDHGRLASAEIGNRKHIRERPPAILVTNITMLEYLLLRAEDGSILERSQGLLRWIVLDEAHGYIGAQAAEMALLLRRVRAAFGVTPEQTRLMATSATIGEGDGTEEKLRRFVSGLAGVEKDRTRVIQGRTVDPKLPPSGADALLKSAALAGLSPQKLWDRLAPHPRLQRLKRQMSRSAVSLSEVERRLFDDDPADRKTDAQAVLDAAALATNPETGLRLLPWRAHMFHRAQGGLWACIDSACGHRDPELAAEGSDWGFGAIWLAQRDRCDCGAPVFELFACDECGAPHLVADAKGGAMLWLAPHRAANMDEFAVDAEPASAPEGESENSGHGTAERGRVVLSPARSDRTDHYVALDDGRVYDNDPPEGIRFTRLALVEDDATRSCCPGAAGARLTPQRYGPAFFMGATLPATIETLARPLDKPGLPMGGRRALTFADSRQGTARLAAKLQQDAERSLTRAFLYHAVSRDTGLGEVERAKKKKQLMVFRANPEDFGDEIERLEKELAGEAKPIPWRDLVNEFGQQEELRNFAGEVWRERAQGGREMADEPAKLAEMFLLRELFRRPKVQNNAETMGLVRLSFPALEMKARGCLPPVLAQAKANADDWNSLALAAVDFVFRDSFAARISPFWLERLVNPRGGAPHSICSAGTPMSDRSERSRPWPSTIPRNGRLSRLQRLVYAMLGGDPRNASDRDRAAEVSAALWSLLTTTVARDIGRGAFQIDFGNAAVGRLDRAWVCPVTRRIFGYSPAGRSPYDPERSLEPIDPPRLPHANPGGLATETRAEMERWCGNDPGVEEWRRRGLWTDLHDRAATYAPFLRAQEHSAQIQRPVLAKYEQDFRDGKVNFLNCSTTMEMGVDIPNIEIVTNANTPPSISNYRQRAGRVGRRGEPWTFSLTFCRDLPLDRIAFGDPKRYLAAPVTAPAVRLDSPALVARHVNAALLAAFLRHRGGMKLTSSAGAFFGAVDDSKDAWAAGGTVSDNFLQDLRGEWAAEGSVADDLAYITRGTALEGREAAHLAVETAKAFEAMLAGWRGEYSELLARRDAARDRDARTAFDRRACRMRGEFVLGELARRGFTPAYGFPVDVVTFDHLSGHARERDDSGVGTISFGDRRGAASRSLDVAIREYAPGAEVVVDGLVHMSQGVFPAWGGAADTSKLEDLRDLWECGSCHGFGLARAKPENCPHCDAPISTYKKTLRPVGFLGRRTPHTGYENLGHAPYEMPRLSAANAPWRSLPHPEGGRWRADPEGEVMTVGSGQNGCGYALCMACGRAEAEEEHPPAPLPSAIRLHEPLAESGRDRRTGRYCPGGAADPGRVQRNVRFVHSTRTDVFEIQLPNGTDRKTGLALVAGLRESLAERLGAEAREIGVAVGPSAGPAGEPRVSAFLHDRASGGAGFVSRLAEEDWFAACLDLAARRLDCPEECEFGCPACVLRPDLNFGEEQLDRLNGLELAQTLKERLQLRPEARVFGRDSRFVDLPLTEWIVRRERDAGPSKIVFYLHGAPKDWEFAVWPIADRLAELRKSGATVTLVLEERALVDKAMDLARKLDLHRLSGHASFAIVPKLPRAGDAPVLGVFEGRSGSLAVAALDRSEASPGLDWGRGAVAPLIMGPAPERPAFREFPSVRLVELSSGNARLIRAGARLDGKAADFGRAFWRLLAEEAPLTVAAMRERKIRSIVYTDRYLVTPLTLRLLFETIRRAPGSKEAEVTVRTARSSAGQTPGWAVFSNFVEDGTRREVLRALLPDADVEMGEKVDMPHARSFEIQLSDGKAVTILLDQGFGAWRAAGRPQHDFDAEPARQARALKVLDFRVEVEAGQEAPLVLEDAENLNM